MDERIATVEADLKHVKESTDRILHILEGNGHEGVVTKTALNSQAIKRLWWFVGGIALLLAAGSVKVYLGA